MCRRVAHVENDWAGRSRKEIIMCAKLTVIVISMMATSTVAAEEAYRAKVGDKQVSSVRREVTKGGGPSREELSQAAREAVPIAPKASIEDEKK